LVAYIGDDEGRFFGDREGEVTRAVGICTQVTVLYPDGSARQRFTRGGDDFPGDPDLGDLDGPGVVITTKLLASSW